MIFEHRACGALDFSEKQLFVLKQEYTIRMATPILVYTYSCFKTNNYFPLTSRTPHALCSNVIYKFTCSCDMNLTYAGMTSRPLSIRVCEHLDCSNSNTNDSAIKEHLLSCQLCFEKYQDLDASYFEIIRSCNNEYETKINEAILIRKLSPKLNIQTFNNGASFHFNIF